MTKICIFWYPIYDLTENSMAYLWPLRMKNPTIWGRIHRQYKEYLVGISGMQTVEKCLASDCITVLSSYLYFKA